MAEQKDSAPSFRITYFSFDGRGAPLRLTAALGGVSYEDNFITWDENLKARADGKRRWYGPPEVTVFGADGKEIVTIAQSNTCLRYVGRVTGLYPVENPVLAALCDEVVDSAENVMEMAVQVYVEQDEKKKAEMQKALSDASKAPYWLGKFEARLEENEARGCKKGYFVGDSVTIADAKAYYSLQLLSIIILGQNLGDPSRLNEILKPYKKLSAWLALMAGNEAVKKFEADFAAQVKKSNDDKVTSFKKNGKNVYGSL